MRALVRNTNKLKECLAVQQVQEDHPNLEIWLVLKWVYLIANFFWIFYLFREVEDIFDENSLTLPLKDVDVVMSTLGFDRGST